MGNVDKITLTSVAPTVDVLLSPWRRRQRLRRQLAALRIIKRGQPHIKFKQHRDRLMIRLEFDDEQTVMLFDLVWPADLPRWTRN